MRPTDTEMVLIKEDGDKIFNEVKKQISDTEAIELGRAVFASVVCNDNFVSIINICNFKRAIGVHSIYGDSNYMLHLDREIKTAREVESEMLRSGVKLNLVGS